MLFGNRLILLKAFFINICENCKKNTFLVYVYYINSPARKVVELHCFTVFINMIDKAQQFVQSTHHVDFHLVDKGIQMILKVAFLVVRVDPRHFKAFCSSSCYICFVMAMICCSLRICVFAHVHWFCGLDSFSRIWG